MSRRRGPKTKPSNPNSARIQDMAERVIRPVSELRREYDRRGCKPPISEIQQGRPAIEVAGHIIARLEEVCIPPQPEGLTSMANSFRSNDIPVRVIELAI